MGTSSTPANGAKSVEASLRSGPHAIQLAWLGDALHHDVKVRLLDGKAIVGELMGFDQFSLAIWPDSAASPSLLFKHAIAFISTMEQTRDQSQKDG